MTTIQTLLDKCEHQVVVDNGVAEAKLFQKIMCESCAKDYSRYQHDVWNVTRDTLETSELPRAVP